MKKCVLVVEDDEDILLIINLLLHNAGYVTIASTDGEGIAALVEEHKPNLVLMDVRLGTHDGRELCKLIKADHARVPVILMSAHCNLADIYTDSCADDFIPKPFDVEDLVARVGQRIGLAS